MGIKKNGGKKCPVLKIQSFPIAPLSGIQDTCRQGRVQVVFPRDFLAQSGNMEHMKDQTRGRFSEHQLVKCDCSP